MNWKIHLYGDCPECNGTGKEDPPKPFCRICGRGYGEEIYGDTLDGLDKMPCGHDWSDLVEEPDCFECGGSGTIEDYVTIAELGDMIEFEALRPAPGDQRQE